MTTDDRINVDRKYAEVAGHLKACWAFDQFCHRLRRNLADGPEPVETIDLGSSYSDLKQIAKELDSQDHQQLQERLEELEKRLWDATARLREEDSKLSAADLRRFLGRVRRLDEDLLLELLRFYVLATGNRAWSTDLTDKVDFLMSRLGEEVAGPLLTQNRVRLDAFLVSLWDMVQTRPPQKEVVAALARELGKAAEDVANIENLEDLQEAGTIQRYRKLKHGLGPVFVEPSIALKVLATNAALGRKVQKLYDKEEWEIAAGFSRLAGLEESSGLDESLGLELDSLKLDMERLEEGRRNDDLRIDTMQEVRRQVDSVLPRLDPELKEEEEEPTVADPLPTLAGTDLALPSKEGLGSKLLESMLGNLETLLAASSSLEEADLVLQDPGLPLGLERREIEAFLLLRDGVSADTELDQLLLTSASLRLRLAILRDHLEAGASGLTELEAAVALELGEDLLQRFQEVISEFEAAGPTAESSRLRFLRICLMRDYSTLWLEVHGAS